MHPSGASNAYVTEIRTTVKRCPLKRDNLPKVVMAGLVPAIHDLLFDRMKTWMPAIGEQQ
jgi:hypothetical protein